MKKRWIILIVFAAICLSAYLYLRIRKTKDFEPQIKARLAKLVTDASKGLYKLDLEHIEIDITEASVTARNILLTPDSVRLIELEKTNEAGNDIYTISLKELALDGLSPLALLNAKNIDLGRLVLDSPQITITRKKRNLEKKDTGSLYERIAIKDQSYSIQNLLLNNIRLTIVNLDNKKSVSSFKNLSASFTDIKIDSSTINDSTRFLFAKDAVVFIKGFSQVTPGNKYHFDIDSIAVRPLYGTLQFYDLKLEPEGTKEEFGKRVGHQQDRYDIKIKKGYVQNIDWFSILSEDGFYGDAIKIDGGVINIYHDRSLPDGPVKSNNFPHQMLMKAPFPVAIKKMLIKDLFVSYEELNPVSGHTGIVEFYNINGEINNLVNIPSAIEKNPFVTINASADFMNAGKLNAVFRFDLTKEKTGDFSVDATLGTMDGLRLNKITEGLALIKIKSLQVDKLQTHIAGSGKSANGNVQFTYHDLAFDVLKNDDGELKKRGLFSFIANTIMINKSNPAKENKPAKQFSISRQHDPHRSFFNLVWKTLLDGVLKTVK